MPYIAIPSAYVPKEFIEDPDSFESTLFRAAIIKWPARLNHPEGKLFGTIGQIGEIAVESEAILLNNGITWDERFGDAEMECLPATVKCSVIIFHPFIFSLGKFHNPSTIID